ncbi:RNase H family protein [Trichomonas vaginalis G3]|uniref:ribonuclease H n=1 Tax=Trichomonas vaginalis (strain ATCC PRA-98 / G3) TaxID=412133 RepID=A2FNB2_TRIV3|nr:RNA-DNA hybrid ribonuclease protein [Trichomonas vaginalis G3]EAX93608.1 RNase H family protein [Trichomonas vaginalis G3]KAI5546395.1 RNA-DNA hybrid ribonuclease protein [Trichomonas vaginalis G3]|eukprot:XP_001306538.1 RNase H family protein [Trichomonas vaginalis G3]
MEINDPNKFISSLDKSKPVDVYTDGACSGNPGPGGWGVFCQQNGNSYKLGGGSKDTTNQRMELMAAIEGISLFPRCFSLNVYTDSKYVFNGITDWVRGWKSRGWKKSDGGKVLNLELWKRLDQVNSDHTVSWKWVKGHSVNHGNNMADQIAVANIPNTKSDYNFPRNDQKYEGKISFLDDDDWSNYKPNNNLNLGTKFEIQKEKEQNKANTNSFQDRNIVLSSSDASSLKLSEILSGLTNKETEIKYVIQLVLFDKEHPDLNVLDSIKKLVPRIGQLLEK